MAFQLSSTAFSNGDMIPKKYTCDGNDISPPLQWSDAPEGTASYALTCDDPDAPVGTWDHWLLFNIPPATASLSKGVTPATELPSGGTHGKNSWGKLGYGGPCPPGGTHRYFFRLYALSKLLDLPPGATKEQLLKAMKGHVLGDAELMGKYRR